MRTWPTWFPGVQTNFNGSIPNTAVGRTQMDSGRFRQIQRFTKTIQQFNAQWTFTPYQFYIFQSWFVNYISNGADWFVLDVPNGSGLVNLTVRFVGGVFNYQYIQDGYWKVTAQLETEDSQLMSTSDLDTFFASGATGANLTDSFGNLIKDDRGNNITTTSN